jgi:hypothetical protein
VAESALSNLKLGFILKYRVGSHIQNGSRRSIKIMKLKSLTSPTQFKIAEFEIVIFKNTALVAIL